MKTEFQSLQSSSVLQKYLENTAPYEVISLPGIFSMQHHHPLTESENYTRNFLFVTHPFLISSGEKKKENKNKHIQTSLEGTLHFSCQHRIAIDFCYYSIFQMSEFLDSFAVKQNSV